MSMKSECVKGAGNRLGCNSAAVGYGCHVRTEKQLSVMKLFNLLEELLLEHLTLGKDHS